MTHARRRLKSVTLVGVVGLTVVAMLALGGTAAAKVIGQEHYSGTDSFSFDDCGFWLDGESEFSGNTSFRVDKGGEAFLVRDTYSYRDVLTNRDTGEWFVVRGHAVFHEIKGTQVEGSIYEFVAIEAGQPFVLEDSEGNVIVRDRGVIRRTALFDTLGDGEPGGIVLDETVDSLNGPHPSFADDFPFCEIAAELTGA
jgi:hypothetical protein